MSDMTIGELARCCGLAVRTLRFYADAGVLPETSRSESGYRLFGPDAVARARLLRTLRQLGLGLEDIKRVLAAEVPPPRSRTGTPAHLMFRSELCAYSGPCCEPWPHPPAQRSCNA